MSDDPVIPAFMPSLVVVLLRDERSNGAPLTPEEVVAVRDGGVCVMLPRSVAVAVTEKRGYDDIDPDNAWHEWPAVRATFPEIQGSA